jgi:glycosyltransferase involved in cell wall biosynthesis
MNKSGPILILCNRVPYPLKDGGALAMHALIKGWHELGCEVHVLAMNTSRHHVHADALPELYRQIASFTMVETDNTIRAIPTLVNLLFSKKPQHAARFHTRHFAQKLRETIQQVQPVLIQMESIYLAEYLPLIRSLSQAKVVQRLHNIEYQVWQRLASETSNPLMRYYLGNLARRIRRYEHQVWYDFDLLLPITTTDEQEIRASGCNTPIHTTPFGIDMSRLPDHAAAARWDGYHIGAMDWLPNKDAINWFIKDIWPGIHQLEPHFSFYFAGRNMPEQFTQYQGEGLYCMGEVADADAFISDKKILVVPLRSGGGIRVKTLEAMAAGKVVISTPTGIQGIEARDREHFLEAATPKEFAYAVKWCLQNKAEAEQIADNARRLLHEHYDQARIMQALSIAVKRVLSR